MIVDRHRISSAGFRGAAEKHHREMLGDLLNGSIRGRAGENRQPVYLPRQVRDTHGIIFGEHTHQQGLAPLPAFELETALNLIHVEREN